ncbi:MAG: DUF3108 domain-containing protein [Burkholderiaceae bacterium]|nr:DUF3108 domain-containing protein [Burkholderiaceae bacterium]
MRSDTPPNTPRGRPPVPVLITLTLAALALHGCLLDGVPVDAAELPLSAVQNAPAVQVRSLSTVSIETAIAPGVEATSQPVAAVALQAVPAETATRVEPALESAVSRAALPEPTHTTEAPPESPSAAAPEVITPAGLSPSAPATDAVPVASKPEARPWAVAAASEPVVLRQPEHPVPVYRTQIPPAMTIEYDISRGAISGTGELTWRHENGRYEARLQASVIGYTLLSQISQGGFDKAGLAPQRFTDQRARKAARAANFQRDAGKITFSGPSDEFALPAGAQDRLSWMIQLPAVLAAEPKRAVTGGEVVLYVVGARADVAMWNLRCLGVESVETSAGAVRTVKFMRAPRGPKDTQAEVWLDPTRHYMPVRARLTQAGDEAEAFELVLRQLKTGP